MIDDMNGDDMNGDDMNGDDMNGDDMNGEVSPEDAARFWAALDDARRFFLGDADVQRALLRVIALLDGEGIPYALAGALALNVYGYKRTTEDVDLLLTPAGLLALKAVALGHGYREKLPGSRGIRDTENNIGIDVPLAGEYPGDGKPKPVRFPDPSVAVRVPPQAPGAGAHVAVLPLSTVVELKLASGISAPHRAKDIGDVVELIRRRPLGRALGLELDPSVRAKYDELWLAAQARDPHE